MKGRMFIYLSFFRLFRIFPYFPYSLFNLAIGATFKCSSTTRDEDATV